MRMAQWLLLSACLYATAALVTTPQIQVVLWKMAHVTVAAHLGYWMDRQAFGRITLESPDLRRLCRAILMGAAMVSVSLGF